METPIVHVKCIDSEELFRVPVDAVYLSSTLADMVDDLGLLEAPIPIKYPAATFRRVLDWMIQAKTFITPEQMAQTGKPVIEDGITYFEERDYLTPTAWENDFMASFPSGQEKAMALRLASFLGMPFLMDLISCDLSKPIQYLRPEDIGQLFHLIKPVTREILDNFLMDRGV